MGGVDVGILEETHLEFLEEDPRCRLFQPGTGE